MPDNEFSIKITGDASQFKEATDAAKEQLDKAGKSVEMLADLIGVKVPDALTKMIASSELAGPALEAVFPIIAGLAAIDVIQQLGQKLGELVSDTFIFTDAQKAEDAALRASNKALYDATLRVKQLGRETQLAAETTQAGKDKLRLQFKLEDLGGSSDQLKAQIADIDGKIAKLQTRLSLGIDTSKIAKPQNDMTASITNTSHAIEEQRNVLAASSAQIKQFQSDRERLNIAFIEAEAVEKKGAQDISNDLTLENAARLQKYIQTNIAQVEADKRSGDAEIQQKQQVTRELAVARQISAEDELSLNKTLLEQKFSQDEIALNKKLEQLKRDPSRNAAKIVTAQGEITALTTQHYTELEKLDADYYKEMDKNGKEAIAKAAAVIHQKVQQSREAQDAAIKDEIEQDKQASDQEIQLIEQRFERGKITQQQEIAEIAKAKENELELERLAQQKRFAIWDGDVKKQAQIQLQINKLVAQAQNVETKAVTDGLKAQEQQYRQVFQQIGNSFKTEVLAMIDGTQTIAQGFTRMYNALIGGLANYIAQKAEKKAEEWAIDKLFHAKSVIAETGAATGKAMTASFASVMSALPFPANVAAAPGVAAAAGAEATGLGLAGLAAMFDIGTNYVPMDGLAFLHKGEKIIPANQQGPGYSGGAGITVVVNHSVSAVDAASFQGHIRTHSNMIANEVTRALKRKGVR